MKILIHRTAWMTSVATLAALPLTSGLQAQTWETALDYQLIVGKAAAGYGIVADALGNVFTGGNGSDAAGNNHGLVLRTDTTLANWLLIDDTNPDPTQDQSSLWNLGLDPNGNLYSIGQLTPGGSDSPFWYVCKSADSGDTWTAVDLYQYAAGQWVDATGFAADDTGNIYIVGWGRNAATSKTPSNIHWLVRRSGDAGQTWALVDDVMGPTAEAAGFVPNVGIFVVGGRFDGLSSWLVRRSATGQSGTWKTVDGPFAQGAARGVCGDALGNIYVSGSMFITNRPATKHSAAIGYYAWTTRKSSDGGNTWSTLDSFTYAPNQQSDAEGIGTDSAGDVIVVGRASDVQGKGHWIVRMLNSAGWQTVDDFQLAPGDGGTALGVTTDAAGNLLVTGAANDSTGSHLIVRRF